MSGHVAEIVEAFRKEFESCKALLDFARAHRPQKARTPDRAGLVINATYARSSKTYQASFRLAGLGYGVQAAMLNRSLFEDMVVAHWVERNPVRAPDMLLRHRQHSVETIRDALQKHGRDIELSHLPPLSEEERAALADEFGRGHWTGASLYVLTKDVEDEWPVGIDRELLWQVFDITHYVNNLLLHHTAFGLDMAAALSEPGIARWDVGSSKTHVHAALLGAFFSYAHTVSLVVDGAALDELRTLYAQHLRPFTKAR